VNTADLGLRRHAGIKSCPWPVSVRNAQLAQYISMHIGIMFGDAVRPDLPVHRGRWAEKLGSCTQYSGTHHSSANSRPTPPTRDCMPGTGLCAHVNSNHLYLALRNGLARLDLTQALLCAQASALGGG
jgi:hypothetical protein